MELETFNSKAGNDFRQVVKYRNFITPDILGYLRINNSIIEISKGEGFSKNIIYGVTVIKNNKHNHDLSKAEHSYHKVEEYVDYLIEKKLI